MIGKILRWTMGALVGGFFLFLMLALVNYLSPEAKPGKAPSPVPPRPTPIRMPAPSPTHTPSLWENVTVGQIRFGEPEVVLTDTLGFRIVGWISGDDVLIQRDIKPRGERQRY